MLYTKVNRNEPCPCGSGKKYKRCCGLQKTVSITSMVEKEVMDLQTQLIQYAMHEYDMEIDRDFESKLDDILTEDEDEIEYYLFVHTIWFALFVPIDEGRTILQRYIEERARTVQRPMVKEILLSWRNPRPIAGRLLNCTADYLTLRDTLTDDVLQIKLLEEIESTENSYLFGFIVPFGTEYIFFPTVFDLEGEKDEKEERFIKETFANSAYEDPIEFLTDTFIELMNELPFATVGYSPDDFEWKRDAHKEVAILFEQKMKGMDAPNTVIATGIILWYRYCEREPMLKKKPESYAAAIHYLNMKVNPLIEVTKKEIALKYGISPSTLGTAIADLEYVLQDEIGELQGLHLEQIAEALEAEGIGFEDDFEDEFEDLNDEEWDDGDLPF